MRRFFITTALLLTIIFEQKAQNSYPKGYFILPINPGQVTSLSGCFGDIRTNHFHSGLDVRTGGVEGKAVVAAADGYVSRIRVQNGGYGNVLYITHPNGFTTVYAHLKEFNKELGQYLTEQQYGQKKWEIDVPVPQGKFEYNKGDLVGLSGNTGGSAGPHLHFEIRDQQENTIDPRLFGFKEIRDGIPPIIEFVSLKCMSSDASINGKFGIFNFKVIKKGNVYVLPSVIKASGKIGVEILTYDRMNNSPFRMGVYEIALKFNDAKAYLFNLEKMSFQHKDDMNIHVNYEKQVKLNQKIHKCYVDEGNGLDLYETNQDWGKLDIQAPSNKVSINVKDSYGNTSNLSFSILKDNSGRLTETTSGASVLDRYLKVTGVGEELKIVTTNNKVFDLELLPSANGLKTAIYDLDKGFPEKVMIDNTEVVLPVNTGIYLSNPKVTMNNLNADFSQTLYDNAFVNFRASDHVLKLHEDVIPLKGHAKIVWTKNEKVNYPDKQKVYLEGSKRKFIGGDWNGNTISFSTREFGEYVTLFDFAPPTISVRQVNADNLRFSIADKLSGINKIECYVNGEWVLMDYEYKTGAIWSRKLNAAKPFSGKVVLKITDNCNNTESYETDLP